MRLAIVTAGAVGAFFGAKFVRQGAQVSFVARGAHLDALRNTGLTISTNAGETHLAPQEYSATDDTAEAVRGADLVLFAVKSFDTAEVARAMLPGLGPATVVMTVQNGVDNEETLAEILGAERTAGGVAYVFAQLVGPGRVSVPNGLGRFVLADKTLAGQPVPHLEELRQLCAAANVPCEITPDIAKVKWTKLVFNSALNGWTSYYRTTVDKLLSDHERRDEFIETMRETEAVGRASGVALDPNVIENTVKLAEGLGPAGSSMLGDLEMGKPLEIEALNGSIVRRGAKLGIPTPLNEKLYQVLATKEQ